VRVSKAMAKQRFRDIKQGRIKKEQNKNKKVQTISNAAIAERIKAFITDSFLLTMPIMYIVFYAVFSGREGFAEHKMLGWIYILIPLVVVQIIFLSRSKLGQTPGMKAYDLALISIKTQKKPSFAVIVLRQLLSIFSLITFGWMSMFFLKSHRTLHDILSSTALIRLPRESTKASKHSK